MEIYMTGYVQKYLSKLCRISNHITIYAEYVNLEIWKICSMQNMLYMQKFTIICKKYAK